MRYHAPVCVLVLATLASAIAGYWTGVGGTAHDLPAPADLERAALVLDVDLPSRVACDEAFDFALYRDLGVELVAWSTKAPALAARSCRGRRVTVKYLPARIRRAALLDRIERLAI